MIQAMPPFGRHGLLVNTDISKQELAYPCAKNSNLTKLEVKEGVCGMPAVTEIEGSSQLVSEAVSAQPATVRSIDLLRGDMSAVSSFSFLQNNMAL